MADLIDRFMQYVLPEPTTGCWLWTGYVSQHGYGMFRFNGEKRGAHKVAYELFIGPVPEGLDLDHTCHKPDSCNGGVTCPHRSCVNPSHLEPVTPKVNSNRGHAHNREKTHCPQGHPYAGGNLYISPPFGANPNGCRGCRICRDIHRAKGKEAA